MALTSFAIELIVWCLTSQDSVHPRIRRRSVSKPTTRTVTHQNSRRAAKVWSKYSNFGMREELEWLTEMSVCDKVELFVLKPLDLLTSAWLVYIMFANSSSRERKELTLEQHRPDHRVV